VCHAKPRSFTLFISQCREERAHIKENKNSSTHFSPTTYIQPNGKSGGRRVCAARTAEETNLSLVCAIPSLPPPLKLSLQRFATFHPQSSRCAKHTEPCRIKTKKNSQLCRDETKRRHFKLAFYFLGHFFLITQQLICSRGMHSPILVCLVQLPNYDFHNFIGDALLNPN
jgi:hypothetical protein